MQSPRHRLSFGLPPLVGVAMLLAAAWWWAWRVDVRHGGRVLHVSGLPAVSTNLLVLGAVVGAAAVLLLFAGLAVLRRRPLVTPSVSAGTAGVLLAAAGWWTGHEPVAEGQTLVTVTPTHGLTTADLPPLLAVAIAVLIGGLAVRAALRPR
jgi:hypothetical protein